jgi:hypothetical protein
MSTTIGPICKLNYSPASRISGGSTEFHVGRHQQVYSEAQCTSCSTIVTGFCNSSFKFRLGRLTEEHEVRMGGQLRMCPPDPTVEPPLSRTRRIRSTKFTIHRSTSTTRHMKLAANSCLLREIQIISSTMRTADMRLAQAAIGLISSSILIRTRHYLFIPYFDLRL